MDWMVAQIRGKFLAVKCDFSEQYDPEKVCYGNPTMRMFRYRFPKERAKQLVHKLNAKSPLTKVTMVDGKMVSVSGHEVEVERPLFVQRPSRVPLDSPVHREPFAPRKAKRNNHG